MFKIGDIVTYSGSLPIESFWRTGYRDKREVEVVEAFREFIDIKCLETGTIWPMRSPKLFTLAHMQLEND